MSCVYYESVFCIHLRPIAVCLSRRATPHVLRTRIPDSSEKWWPTGVTPHALRIRFTHSHAQGVGEGIRATLLRTRIMDAGEEWWKKGVKERG